MGFRVTHSFLTKLYFIPWKSKFDFSLSWTILSFGSLFVLLFGMCMNPFFFKDYLFKVNIFWRIFALHFVYGLHPVLQPSQLRWKPFEWWLVLELQKVFKRQEGAGVSSQCFFRRKNKWLRRSIVSTCYFVLNQKVD